MGIRTLRIPLSDLATPERRGRLRALAEHGFAYTLFGFGAPDTRTRRLIEDHGDLLSAWEAGFDSGAADRDLPEIAAAAATAGVPLYLSRLRSHDELRAEAGRYFHVVNHGFDIADRERVKALLRRPDLAGTLAGLAFRLPAEAPVREALVAIDKLVADFGFRASVHLRTAGFDPSQAERNDLTIAGRMVEALFTAGTLGHVRVFADTLVDHDRGYFVRHGAYDRLCNPRLAARVVRHLNAVLAQFPDCFGGCAAAETDGHGGRRLISTSQRGSIRIFLPADSSDYSLAQAFPSPVKSTGTTFIELASGLERKSVATGPVAAVSG